MNKHSLLKQQERAIEKEIKRIKEEQELEIYPNFFSMPIGVQLELTSSCNLYCKHCYNSSGGKQPKDKMDIDSWLSLIEDINMHGGIFQCILSGGEPLLLRDNLYKIMDPLHYNGTGFILITNGMLVNRSVVKSLQKYRYYWVQVSIDDALPTQHDLFRGVTGSWDKATEAAFLISSAGLPLRIAHSVTPANIERLQDMIDIAFQLGASSIVCGPVMSSGRATLNNSFSLNSNNDTFLAKLYTIIEKNQNDYQGKMDILSSANLKLDFKRKTNQPNSAIVIRPNGDVRIDCTMPFVVGNVLKDSIFNIWKNKGKFCWSNPKVEQYISELDSHGEHPFHKNHFDLDFVLD